MHNEFNEFSSISIPMQLDSVKMLNGTNYEDQVELLKMYLAVTNLNLALRKEEPIIDINSNVELKVNMRNGHFQIERA